MDYYAMRAEREATQRTLGALGIERRAIEALAEIAGEGAEVLHDHLDVRDTLARSDSWKVPNSSRALVQLDAQKWDTATRSQRAASEARAMVELADLRVVWRLMQGGRR